MDWENVASIETIVTNKNGDAYVSKMNVGAKKKTDLEISYIPVAGTTAGWINKMVIDRDTVVSLSVDHKNNTVVRLLNSDGETSTIMYNITGMLVNKKTKKGKDGCKDPDIERVIKLF